jgi:hypothetical protein
MPKDTDVIRTCGCLSFLPLLESMGTQKGFLMTRPMTDDEVTVLEVIMYLQEKGNESFTEDIRRNCVLSESEIRIALSSLRADGHIYITPMRGWVTA